MTRPNSFFQHLRPSPERFAAAAAVQEPSLLLQLRAAQPRDGAADRPVRAAPAGESGGALLLVAAVALRCCGPTRPGRGRIPRSGTPRSL